MGNASRSSNGDAHRDVGIMVRDHSQTLDLAHLLFIAKNVERVGDHATNVAENVVYLVTGATPLDERPKQDESSSLTRAAQELGPS